jgi:hypothetical protein
MNRGLRILARTWLAALALLTATYALLAYIPFTYQAVIRFPMVNAITVLVHWHPLLWLATGAGNLAADWPRRREPGRRVFHSVQALLALAVLVHPPLAGIRNDGSSLGLALLFILLPCWLLILDIRSDLAARDWHPGDADEPRRLCLAALTAAGFGALLFPSLAWLRSGLAPAASWDAAGLVLGWGLWAILLTTLAAAALLMGVLSLGRFLPRPWASPALLALTLWLGLLQFVRTILFNPIAFHGVLAGLVAAAIATLAVALLGMAALGLDPLPGAGESALDLALRPLARILHGHRFRAGAALLLLALLTGLALARTAVFDWNFMFQKSTVVAVEALVFAGAYAALPIGKPRVFWIWSLILGPILVMNLFLAFDEGLVDRTQAASAGPRLGPVLEQQAGRDVMIRLLRELLAPVQATRHSIYQVLQKNSNIPHAVRTDPVAIQHVDRLEPVPGPKPDIYLFVVDSMRRDYLGAYNPKVHFTPELDRFAAESLVMRNAFTRYGATGLSEPSIWAGALMLHKQYITPFFPMNSLEKLLKADGYQGLVSMDNILDVVVEPGPWLTSLDPGLGTQDLRLGTSLGKVGQFLDQRGQDPRPLFVYSQAQDLHISVVNREGQTVVTPGDYTGFHPPYASRLHRLDQAFGQFIADLKRRGRFENSIIIVTADHGDSLGEEGRFGHAYTLFPEIVRVPMLIHLPAALRQGLSVDPDNLAFLTDLTPTLYYLLGHRPIRVDPMLGKPLFTVRPEELAAYHQDHYLLASSYGAVFGVLEGNGKSLYISDGVEFVDYLYRLDEGANGLKRAVTPEAKGHYDQIIVEDIGKVNTFYRFHPGE